MTAPLRIGPYAIERLLGVGSFATVWLGHDPALDAHVAIKVLAENWSHDLRVRERFLDEARLLRRLEHERLIRVHAVGELPDGRPYAVLAWANGGSLRDRLAAAEIPVPAALRLLGEVCAGVAVLHRHGVVHRDLTPGNILFRSVGPDAEQVLIADLGLAKALAAASGLTARAGTPGYMAPEQDDPGAVVDTRADVYGLGRLGIRLLATGPSPANPAGPGPSPANPARPGPRRDLSEIRLRDGVPTAVAAVLARATAQHPADRYPDATTLRAALTRASTPARRPAAPTTTSTPARRPAAPTTTSTPARRPAASTTTSGPAGLAASSGAARREPSPRPSRRHRIRRAAVAVVAVAAVAAVGAEPAGTGSTRQVGATYTTGPLTVALPAGWSAAGATWAGQYDADGEPEPALVMSPQPRRWAADPRLPGAFVGLSASTAARATPAGFLAERTHGDCTPAPARTTRQAGVEWTVVAYRCDQGRPRIVESAALHPGRAALVYAQITPPPDTGTTFVDTLLAGVRVR
ncbi:protein kinase [Micromonospora sp. NPDC048835]|uniref:serine/threonine-protein kinase n=1 Tax=Micromonospora sp. NPDC048835 TaxID=3155147 RepID=UPI0033CDFE14